VRVVTIVRGTKELLSEPPKDPLFRQQGRESRPYNFQISYCFSVTDPQPDRPW
jgi:hypothetical protein